MTDQIQPDAPFAQVNGSGTAHANGSALARKAGGNPPQGRPIAHWPGDFVRLDIGEVFVRSPPADSDATSEPGVFVHGLGGSATNWTDLMGLLGHAERGAPALDSAAIDLPGFGFSPPPRNGDYSLDARAAAVISLIENIGMRPVHLVGNSLGGAICTRIAARRPDLVRTLTLISPALPDLRPRLLPIRLALVSAPGIGTRVLRRLQAIPPERRTDMTINDLFADPSLMHRDRRAEAVAEVVRRDGLDYASDALLKSGRALVSEYARPGPGSLWRDAARVAAPTLVIHGSHDRLVNPATAARAARSFRYGRAVVLPRIGHVAMMERPDLVAAEMQEFIAAAARAESSRGGALDRVGS
ncbi:MAG TPA: alpha/beta fold hydrolase [Streptosporangiaceae bacterium]|nr:alpha/beta fold hydrolase [Streptosporangiaceae bacterium]